MSRMCREFLERPEMKEMGNEIERVLDQPQLVKRSRSDEAVLSFYEFYTQTMVGGKWLCVVVKYLENDAFVVTAYLTDKPKPGEDLSHLRCPAILTFCTFLDGRKDAVVSACPR
ncbi:MAG TPA: DUF4258 domain-containing protein [Candidatus Udaeobacter sp.]|nr:DUF4258 domain-containing protein [Candidatus Udaeobacter sp.]